MRSLGTNIQQGAAVGSRAGRHAWVGLSAASLALGIALAAYPFALARPSLRISVLAVLGLGTLAAGVATARGSLTTASLGLLGMQYAAALFDGDVRLDPLAPVVAVMWLGLLELSDLAALSRRGSVGERDVWMGRGSWAVSVAIGGGVAAGLATLAGASSRSFGHVWLFAGLVCAFSALAITVWFAWRAVRSTPERADEPVPATLPERSS
jgi:hypothetical protein